MLFWAVGRQAAAVGQQDARRALGLAATFPTCCLFLVLQGWDCSSRGSGETVTWRFLHFPVQPQQSPAAAAAAVAIAEQRFRFRGCELQGLWSLRAKSILNCTYHILLPKLLQKKSVFLNLLFNQLKQKGL